MTREKSDQFAVRMPGGMRVNLKDAAAKNRRSMNTEIVARLEASFDAPREVHGEISRLLDEYINRKVAERLSEIARTLGAK